MSSWAKPEQDPGRSARDGREDEGTDRDAFPSPEDAVARFDRAWEARAALHTAPDLDVYRLFHGHHDGIPGLDVDRFAQVVLMVQKREFPTRVTAAISARLGERGDFDAIGLKTQERRSLDPGARDFRLLAGTAPADPIVVVQEGRLRFATEPFHRESPGLFLDARPVRSWLLESSAERDVLNLFSHAGSLGVAAAVGGARHVTHVDSKAAPLRRARENHRLNGLPDDPRDFLQGDLYVHLPKAARAGRRFGGVILDPPPQIPRRKRRRPVGQDYPNLIRLVAPLLAPGGWVACFFHRYERTRAESEAEVLECAGVPLEVSTRLESGPDFPESNADEKLQVTVFVRRSS